MNAALQHYGGVAVILAAATATLVVLLDLHAITTFTSAYVAFVAVDRAIASKRQVTRSHSHTTPSRRVIEMTDVREKG